MNVKIDPKTGACITAGVDFSGPVSVAAVSERDLVLAVKIGAGSCWSGIGQPRLRTKTHYALFKITTGGIKKDADGQVIGVSTTDVMPFMEWDARPEGVQLTAR